MKTEAEQKRLEAHWALDAELAEGCEGVCGIDTGYSGSLVVSEKEGRCYWGVYGSGGETPNFKEIPRNLYDNLRSFSEVARKAEEGQEKEDMRLAKEERIREEQEWRMKSEKREREREERLVKLKTEGILDENNKLILKL